MSGWMAALRIARREARRSKGRSALVVALIGLPVLAASFAAVSYDSFRLTPEQEVEHRLGAADAHLTWMWDGPVTQSADGMGSSTDGERAGRAGPVTEADLRQVLPADARVVPLISGDLALRTATGVGVLAAEVADLTDPVHAGRLAITSGRADARDDEVAVTGRAASRLGVSIGDGVQDADQRRGWTVTGLVEYSANFRPAVVFASGGAPADEPALSQPHSWLLVTGEPVTWDDVGQLNHGRGVRPTGSAVRPASPRGPGNRRLPSRPGRSASIPRPAAPRPARPGARRRPGGGTRPATPGQSGRTRAGSRKRARIRAGRSGSRPPLRAAGHCRRTRRWSGRPPPQPSPPTPLVR